MEQRSNPFVWSPSLKEQKRSKSKKVSVNDEMFPKFNGPQNTDHEWQVTVHHFISGRFVTLEIHEELMKWCVGS